MKTVLKAKSFSKWLNDVLDIEQRHLIEKDSNQAKRESAKKIIVVTTVLDVVKRFEDEMPTDFGALFNLYIEDRIVEKDESLFKFCVDLAYENVELRVEQLGLDNQDLQFEIPRVHDEVHFRH